ERDRVVDTALEVEPVLDHVDADVMLVAFFLVAMVVVMVMIVVIAIGMHVRAVGDAVVGAVCARRQAEVAAVAQPGRADAAGAGTDGTVVQAATARLIAILVRVVVVVVVVMVMLFQPIDHRIAGDAV